MQIFRGATECFCLGGWRCDWRALRRRIGSDDFDVTIGQAGCWLGSILVLGLGFFKLASLPLTETELFFGLLLVLAVALLGVNLGLLLRIEQNTRSTRD